MPRGGKPGYSKSVCLGCLKICPSSSPLRKERSRFSCFLARGMRRRVLLLWNICKICHWVQTSRSKRAVNGALHTLWNLLSRYAVTNEEVAFDNRILCQTRRGRALLSRLDAETEKRDRACWCFLECVASSPLGNVGACEGASAVFLNQACQVSCCLRPLRIVTFAIKFLARSGNSTLQHSRWKAVVKQPPKIKQKSRKKKKKRAFVVWC